MYPIIGVPSGSAQSTEPLGTKYKFWFKDAARGLSLFKEGRLNTDENCAEKIACELARALSMPHAAYDLAEYEGRRGTVSISLVTSPARIVHGNELIAAQVTDYVLSERNNKRNPNHTLRRVMAYFRESAEMIGAPYGWQSAQSENIKTALDFMVGYLMFDAWIGNQDRHDENWGILRTITGNYFLSPSYDHGSSMGRNLSDDERSTRLRTHDRMHHISAFVEKAESALFPATRLERPKPLRTMDAFEQAAAFSRRAATEWVERLRQISDEKLQQIIGDIPTDWMSPVARDFTLEFLRLNRSRILNLNLK